MNNSDVLWAWVAGVVVSLILLATVSRTGPPAGRSPADGRFILPEVALGAGHWDFEEWERTGGTPHRAAANDGSLDALDLLEGVLPAAGAIDGNATAEGPSGTAWP